MAGVRNRAVLALSLLLWSATALADDKDKDKARAFAQEAGDLLEAQRYDEALDRARKAEALFHAPTHLLMMGEALQALGHPAEAMATYERMAAEPLPITAPPLFRKAQATARERLRELGARTPSLLVRVSGLPADRVTAKVDGQPLDVASGVAVRMDPGAHRIEIGAEGHAPFERTVTLEAKGGVVVLDAALAPRGVTPPKPAPEAPARKGSLMPSVVTLAAGGALALVGAVTGGISLSRTSALKIRCPDSRCSPAEQSDIDAARAMATTSNVTFVLAGAGLAAGAVLFFVRPGGAAPPSGAARLTPWLGAGSAGVRGVF
jgi:hypothetical protein